MHILPTRSNMVLQKTFNNQELLMNPKKSIPFYTSYFRFKQLQISWTIVKDQLSLFRHSISHWLSPFTLSCTSSNPKRPGFTEKSLALVMSCPTPIRWHWRYNGTCRLHRLSATAVSRRWRACPPPAPAHSGPVTVLPPS